MTTVTATELARRTREILDQVLSEGETIVVERNARPIAELVPAPRRMTARQALAGLQSMVSVDDAKRWLDDSRDEFGNDVRDPWA
ncbi:MAG: type II toxin-antitoxin system Phd/YefM family antitoxin [Rhodanobacteraceae bacterium]|jgi:antitoxin (DNA-binding transcriptional repressor) of toxin-antitoxin stability system|nr:type II toxin-antitoxin system Phd/YefM family antitoxin [Rhodanobacteraceae bacterium]MBL0041916.1 type II toxin-antitoxin system Phd/YefM family antitoxin [Xanthomonadales bacterium]MBP6077827.1 type II toxin-antitoxin system Phd/YefM family antitoxin [Xanthomonadales bacterium]MBP7625405.1 type II toxin-antitoxin system Phd/YefM family antitoxin [Xanthomonadales bacterium]